MAVEIPLHQTVPMGSPKLVCDQRGLDLRVPWFFKDDSFLIAPADVAGVAVLGGFDIGGVAWEREPNVLFVRTAHAFSSPTLILLLQRPVRLPPLRMGAAMAASLPPKVGREGVVVDAVTVTVADAAAAVAALSRCGVPVIQDLREAMDERFGVVEDPVRARALERERRSGISAHLRTWWWLYIVVASVVTRQVMG